MKVALYALSAVLVTGPAALWIFLLSYYGWVPDEAAVTLAGARISLRLVLVVIFAGGLVVFLATFIGFRKIEGASDPDPSSRD